MPMIKAHGLVAAIFGVLVAVVTPLVERLPGGYGQWAMVGFAIAYVLVVNRWLVRAAPPPAPPTVARKGSFKKRRGQGWAVARWGGTLIGIGLSVQLVVFLFTYYLTSLLLVSAVGG